MPAERLTMRKIHEVLRLTFACGLAARKVAASCGISRTAVGNYVRRATAAGLSWPLPESLDDGQLESLLFPPQRVAGSERSEPDWSAIHTELKRKGVTLQLLWQEYKEQHPDGYQYSRFCDRYREWAGRLNLVMRQEHRAGEKTFLDYCGPTVAVMERGLLREAQIFVAVLGASNYTYAEATWTQSLPDWIGSHVRTFEFFGGVSRVLVPDNLRSGISKACRYEPDINPTYQDLASHYQTAVIPARVRKPRDKAKVEVAVQIVERWILARLRNTTFSSLAELNTAIRILLVQLNERPFKRLPGCRKELFETLDKPALTPLPAEPYRYAEWKKARVNIDYHIEVTGHYYSVPYKLVSQEVDVRMTDITVECFFKSHRVASHMRSDLKGHHTTIADHMPKAHQQYAQWTPERIRRWADRVGLATGTLAHDILSSRIHPAQGFRSILGILRLGKVYGEDRLEAACRRALIIKARSYKSIESILKNNLDRKPLSPTPEPKEAVNHDNIRGAHYYKGDAC